MSSLDSLPAKQRDPERAEGHSLSLAEAGLEKTANLTLPEDSAAPISKLLPTVMATALFMDLLDTAALGTALPTMARDFDTTPLQLKLALTAYLMTMAILVPASGWLADRYGARRVFLNAMKIFIAGSLWCGLADSMTELVAARVLQGIGGAMMTPVARLIVVATTPRARLVQAMNAFTIPAVVGPLLGPPLAGVLLEVANWRWIFFINIPIGILGMLAVLRIVPRLRHEHPGPFDGYGFAIAAVGITALLALSESIGTDLLPVYGQVLVAACGIAAWAGFILRALRIPAPMLDLRLFAKPTYRASMLGGSLLRLGIGATAFLVPLLLQAGLGWSPLKAGSVVAAIMLGSILARLGGTFSVRHFGFRCTLVVTAALTAVFTVAPAFFTVSTPVLTVVVTLVTAGFFRAAHYVAASAIAYGEIKPEQVSRASTLSTVIQQLSMSFGVSFAGLTLYLSAGNSIQLIPQNFVFPFAALAVAAILAVPIYLRLHPEAGANMRYGGSTSQ